MILVQNCVRQSRSPTKMAATVQLRCYWKQLWSKWAITGSWEPLVLVYSNIEYIFQTRRFLCEFPIGSCVKLNTAVQPSWSEGGTTRHIFGKGPFNDYNEILFLVTKTRKVFSVLYIHNRFILQLSHLVNHVLISPYRSLWCIMLKACQWFVITWN
jgi:hypothetical protein